MANGKPGRPTKYDPAYCDRVREYGAEGDGVAEIAAHLEVSKQTLHNWQAEHSEFLDAMTHAKDLAEAWWARQGKKGIWSKDFNASAYRLQMMNRFAWGEKSAHELTGAEGGPVHVEVVHTVVDPSDDEDPS